MSEWWWGEFVRCVVVCLVLLICWWVMWCWGMVLRRVTILFFARRRRGILFRTFCRWFCWIWNYLLCYCNFEDERILWEFCDVFLLMLDLILCCYVLNSWILILVWRCANARIERASSFVCFFRLCFYCIVVWIWLFNYFVLSVCCFELLWLIV